MKKALKSIISFTMVLLLILSTFACDNGCVFATDPSKGIEISVDRSELDDAIQAATDAGVPVQKTDDVDKGVATSKAEVDDEIVKIKEDYKSQIKAINEEIQKKEACDKQQEEYEAKLAIYKAELAKYEADMKKYEQDMLAYNTAMAEWELHKNEDGYLPQPMDQALVFESEPNATLTVEGSEKYNHPQMDALVRSWGFGPGDWGYEYFAHLNNGLPGEVQQIVPGDRRVLFEVGKTLTATYTNLQNSSINGKKIAKVVFKYTPKSTTRLPGKIPGFIKKDPTATVWYTAFFGDTTIGVNVQFFDENDQPMSLDGGLVSFSSLNRGDLPKAIPNYNNSIEKVQNFSGQLIEINGSSIKNHNGSAYSDTNNAYLEDGSRFLRNVWDTETSPVSWYGAIVGKVNGKSVDYDMAAEYKGNIWFAFNSKIRAKGVPEKPVKPVEPEKPTPPQCPNIQANYHYDVLFYQPPVEKKVMDQNNTDINNQTVLKNSVVKFSLNVEDFPAGREKIESLVFNDLLPAGYEVDLDATKQASPNYDVDYDEGTNKIVFSAKAGFVQAINADLNKDIKIPAPVIIGKVTKPGTTYINNFELNINNKYSVKSEPVKVHTPPEPIEPKKDVFSGNDTTSINGEIVQPGQELRYEITYKNTTGTKQTVTITDKIPAFTEYVDGSADNDGVESGGVITWTKEVEDGESLTVSFKVKVNADVNGNPVDNVSHVEDGLNESYTNETHNPTPTPTPTEPKKDVFSGDDTTSINGEIVQPGQELRYEITYKNTTGTKQTVTITDKIPAFTEYVDGSADNDGVESGGVITWTKEVENGESLTVSFKVKVNADVNGNPVDNVSHVKDGVNESDTNETHNPTPTPTPTPTEPKKDVFSGDDTTSINGEIVQPGQELRYEITYKNTTGTKQTVTITDKIPAFTEYVDGSADNDGVESGGVITWTKEVEDGESLTVSFKVKVNADVNGNPVDNVSHVKDGMNESDTNETHNPTPTEPKKDVFSGDDTTSINGEIVQPGQELRYEITYKNTTGTKQTVTITDKIPAFTEYVDGSADNDGVESGGVITWTKEVENGESLTVSFKVKVNADVNGNPVDNVSHVKDGMNESDTNETHNPTPTEPKKNVFSGDDTTSIDGKIVQPGQELRYEITYKNTTGTKQTVTITDKIPAFTKYVDGSADNDGVESGGVITWTKEVENGESLTVSFKVKVNADVNGNPVDNVSHVKDGMNESDTNETHNPTPTEPKKDVFSGDDTTSINGEIVQPGQELRYEITYKNTTGTKQTVTITDKIPAFTKYVDGSADNDGVESGGVITWTKEVENGESLTVSFKVKVNADVNGNPVDNVSHVKDGMNESDTNETHNPTPTPTEPKKDVFSGDDTTSINGEIVQPGQELRYEITYKNTTGTKQTVTITDKIPAFTEYVDGSADNDGVESGGVITWTKEVENGESLTVSFKVKVNADVNGNPVDNVSHVKDGMNESDTNETHNPTPTEPKKDVFSGDDTTSINGEIVQPGQELRYEITYKNTTGTKQTVTITDKIPAFTKYVDGSADNDGVESGGVITWTKEVENGESLTVSFKVKVNADVNGNPVDNVSHVKDGMNESDTNETHNPTPTPTPTEPKKDVFSGDDTTSINGEIVQPGQELRYEITYKNTTGTKQTVTITDKIPAFTEYVDGSADNDGVESGGVITWTKEVENGESLTVSFKVKVNADVNGNPVDNVSHVKDGMNESDTNETHNPTPTEPKKDVFSGDDTTSINGEIVQPGQELRYEITYKNTTGTKQTVTITDKIPAFTEYVDGSADNDGVESGGVITWTKEVENGESLTVSFKVKVNADVNGNPVDNVSHVKDGMNESDTNETHNPTPTPTPTPTEPKKDVFSGDDTTSINGEIVQPGQELRYEITYKNTTGTKQTVTITDKIPAFTEYVDGSADNDGVESGGVITWTKEVEDGESLTVSFKVKVNADVNGNPVDNVSHVKDGMNESDTNETHNPTPTPTPTEPKKDVFSGDDTTSINGEIVQPGQELRYEITYKNTTGTKQTVTITDKIPAFTEYVDGSADNDGVESGGVITWTKEVENGESLTVSFKVKVNADVNGNPVDNVSHVKDGMNESDTNETHNPTPTPTPTPTEPKKDVFSGDDTTSINGEIVQPGQELRYEITYKNTTGTKQTVTITDKIPAFTEYVDGSADNDGVESGGVITWTKEVEDGESLTVSFKVKVNADVNGNPVDNVSHVKDGMNESDTNETHNPTPTPTPTPTEPKKDVFSGDDTTSINGEIVQPGQELRYEITYKNTTGTKQTVTITDKIPAFTEYVDGSADNDGVESGGVITWTKEVEDGESLTVSFKVKVNADVNGNPVDNVSHVKDGMNESYTNETHNPTPTPTEPKKDVFSGDDTTSINGEIVQPGQELRYEITYKNTTGTKQTVTITDKIPAFTEYVDGSADNDGVESGGVITWTKEVENGESLTVSFKVKVNADVNGNPVDNVSHVKDGMNESDTNETHNPTPTEPKKNVFSGDDTTSIDGKIVQPGQELRYEITYKNTTGTKQTVTITDKIPAFTKYVDGSADNDGVESGGVITWTKEVENGESLTVSFKVKVNADVNGNPVDNVSHVKDGVNESDTNKTHNPTLTPPPTEPKKPDTPETGDSNDIMLHGSVLFTSLGAMIFLYLRKKKRTDGEL